MNNTIMNVFRYFFRKSVLVYGIVGVLVTAVQISILFLLRSHTQLADFLSITISYIIALVLHYFLNKHLTFLVNDRKIFNLMSLKYVIVVIISYLIYMANIFFWYRVVGVTFNIALFITLIINYVINYVLYEKVVFKNRI